MQRLNTGMMERYEIPEHRPKAARAVQFGLDDVLLGTVDRLLDGADLGIACVPDDAPEALRRAELLREQEGLFTVIVRGYAQETPVRREQVVQAILEVTDPADATAWQALAARESIDLAILHAGTGEKALARFLHLRREMGLGGLTVLCAGEAADCAEGVRRALLTLEGEGFEAWLNGHCAFLPMLADSLALRADAEEAARLCREMNYADGMLILAEPWARLTIQAPAAFRAAWPLDAAEGIEFVDDIAPAMAARQRLFETGLFLMAAPGWLLGCDTLVDCMRHERLRDYVGRAYMTELLPLSGLDRDAAAPLVIRAFERFENPLNKNPLLPCAAPLLARFARAALPMIDAHARENFEPPRLLSFALAATVMLYAGARPGTTPEGSEVYTVVRGKHTEVLPDDPAALAVFSTLAHDMPPESLAYAALADRELWHGRDLRQIDGLLERVALDIAAIQRDPSFLPGE